MVPAPATPVAAAIPNTAQPLPFAITLPPGFDIRYYAQNIPNGVVFHENALYVAEINRIQRFDEIEANLANPPAPIVVTQGYPADTWHGWKYLRLGPDGNLYAPVGAPCNVCETSGLYGTITRIRPDGTVWRCTRGASAIQLALIGIHAPKKCGLPKMGTMNWVTTFNSCARREQSGNFIRNFCRRVAAKWANSGATC